MCQTIVAMAFFQLGLNLVVAIASNKMKPVGADGAFCLSEVFMTFKM